MRAQVQFIEGELSLIHIPLHLYPYFIQPILRLLLLSEDTHDRETIGQVPREPWMSVHRFLNISITPLECSLVCPRQLAQELFASHLERLGPLGDEASISADDYMVIQVDGDGLDAGRRVVELTSPLAMAGISIFFITTYFADYILVPTRSKGQVVRALEERGFVFEKHTEAFINQNHEHQYCHQRSHSSTSSLTITNKTDNNSDKLSETPPPPPPSNLDELQWQTFSLLRRQNVAPSVDPSIRLIQCAGRKDTGRDGLSAHMLRLRLGLVKCLAQQPRFLSLSLTDTEPASLLLEKELVQHFTSDDGRDEDGLLGTRQDVLVPIILDLRRLPLELTGIVCGVAGRLVGATALTERIGNTGDGHGHGHGDDGSGSPHHSSPSSSSSSSLSAVIDMSYLSTVRAGTVMVSEAELQKATEALRL